jgi:hypothetical protein
LLFRFAENVTAAFLPDFLPTSEATCASLVQVLPEFEHKSQGRSQKQYLLWQLHKSAADSAAQARFGQNYSLFIHLK